jgi:ELWxxDGT repeat protein
MKTAFWRHWWSRACAARRNRVVSHRGRPLRIDQLEDRTLPSAAQLLADIHPGGAFSTPTGFVVIGSEAYFAASEGTHGDELWKSDGTAAGTTVAADINPGAGSSYPSNLTNVNGTLFFAANDGTHGTELWKSDGTAAGAVMVADINPGAGSSLTFWSDLTNVNGTLFFMANDGTHGDELWKSDGTAAGTVMVADINPGAGSSYPSNLTNVNGTLFFTANDGTHGTELWKSDGTAADTVMVADMNPGSGSSNPTDLTNVNGTLFFTAIGANGDELWKSDGTTAGTVNLTGSFSALDLTNVNGRLYFTADEALWKCDGTAAGTVCVAGLDGITDITNVNGELYFSANDGANGWQLWKSDGTTAGTTMVKDINPGTTTTWYYTGTYGTYTNDVTTNSSSPSQLTNVNGTLYFTANDGTHGPEAWTSDGTTAGTTLVADINPGSSLRTYTNYGAYGTETRSATLPDGSYPNSFTKVNGALLFTANDGTHGNALWEIPAGPGFAISATSSTPTAGAADSFTITARNADGTTNTSYSGTVAFTSSDGQASLPADYTFTPADAGVHTFSATLKTAGTQSIRVTDTTAGTIGSDPGITVLPAAASTLSVTGFPTLTTAGVAGNFTVTLEDRYGNIASGYTGTVHFTSSDGKATLPGNYTFTTTDGGVHTFSATLKTAGTQSLTVTDTVTGSLTARDGGIMVSPAPASQFVISAPSSVNAGVAFRLTVTVEDAYGNVVTGYTGTVHFGSTDTRATLPSNYTFTASDNGVHTFSGLVLRKKGNQKITIADTQNSSLTASAIVDVL